MAGGFDGIGVSTLAHQPTATQLKGRCDRSKAVANALILWISYIST